VVQNGSGGVATIQNAGSIGMSIFGGGANTTADAPAVVAYGGGQVNFTNTGTITGRIGFEAPGAAGVGNTFLNAGTINGSVYLGNSAAGNTFTVVSGSSVNSAGVATAGTMNTGAATINFAAAGIVDAGTGTNNTLVLQNSATGAGSGTGGAVTTISASNYLDFQKLVAALGICRGTWLAAAPRSTMAWSISTAPAPSDPVRSKSAAGPSRLPPRACLWPMPCR
jgi:fibronectin-binding autotransporter adhesin